MLKKSFSFAPFFDHGSSLCAYIPEKNVELYLGKDRIKFESLVNSKSKSRIRIDGSSKKEPSHMEVMEYLFDRNPKLFKLCVNEVVKSLSKGWIEKSILIYPDKIISAKKKILIQKYLYRKLELLNSML